MTLLYKVIDEDTGVQELVELPDPVYDIVLGRYEVQPLPFSDTIPHEQYMREYSKFALDLEAKYPNKRMNIWLEQINRTWNFFASV
jgi:hypothetical protein